MNNHNDDLHKKITNVDSDNRNEVVQLALLIHAAMLVSHITPDEYAINAVLLTDKLGYSPLPIDNVQKEADKLLRGA